MKTTGYFSVETTNFPQGTHIPSALYMGHRKVRERNAISVNIRLLASKRNSVLSLPFMGSGLPKIEKCPPPTSEGGAPPFCRPSGWSGEGARFFEIEEATKMGNV